MDIKFNCLVPGMRVTARVLKVHSSSWKRKLKGIEMSLKSSLTKFELEDISKKAVI